MKMKKMMKTLSVFLIVISMLLGSTLTAVAFDTPNDIKSVALTLNPPVAGETVDLSYGSVSCDAPMDYKVIGVHWYKGNKTDPGSDRLGRDGNEDYFVGGYNYTVRVELAVKGDKTWNIKTTQDGYGIDYSHMTATINGQTAEIGPHEISPDFKTICVSYVFYGIPVGEVTPYVYIGKPVAGKTVSEVVVEPGNERSLQITPLDYTWYEQSGNTWQKMESSDTFVAGKDYRITCTVTTKEGFRYRVEGAHTVGDDGYIYGYVNGKQMSMKLDKYADVFLDFKATFSYDFVSCEAQKLDSVSFSGIQAPVAGQHPQYAVTMGDSTYSLVTDDAVSGGAEYGFVNGLAWKLGYGAPLTAQSTFEQGAYYTLSFFIRSDDIHRFTDMVVGSANVGYVSVQTMDDPTLAFVTVDFALCGGGVMNTLNVGGFREPVNSASPDYNLITGQGYEKHGEIQWIEVTDDGDRVMDAGDSFVYGNQYKAVMVLKATDGFTFAARDAMTVNVNGQEADMLTGFESESESEYITVVKYFECAKATVDEVDVTVEAPMEGNNPAQQIVPNGDSYTVDGFLFTDVDNGGALKSDDVFANGKSYYFMGMLVPENGYQFSEGTTAVINGQEANVIAFDGEKILIGLSFIAEGLPYYNINFMDEMGGTAASTIITKAGFITLPEYEMIVPEGYKFAGWTLDGGQTLLEGEYYVSDHADFVAVLVEIEAHQHVYDDNFKDNGQGFHEKGCIDVENCDDYIGSIISEMHQYGNSTACDVICTVCGYERTEDIGFGYHNFEFECSEVCSTCGKQRETKHTPGEAATCVKAQTCTVCSKELAPKNDAHTPGEAATCVKAQVCTACGKEVAPKNDVHTPGEAATCDKAQLCTACGAEVAPKTDDHTPGEAATCVKAQLCTVCGIEVAPKNDVHTPGDPATCDKAQLCTACGAEVAPKTDDHTPGAEATCTEAQICTVCGTEIKPANGHSAGVEWITDETGHHKLCACGAKVDEGAHTDDDGDKSCDACAYKMSKGLSTGVIIVIVIAAVAVLGGGGFCLYWFVIRKKKIAKE